MDPFTIISLIFAIIGTAISVGAGVYSNQQNKQIAQRNWEEANASREDNQQFEREQQENANRATIDMFNAIDSPAARRAQLENAGLSVGLMYGGGGQGGGGHASASAAAPAGGAATNAPFINPILDMMTNPMDALRETTTATKTQTEVRKIEKEVDVMDKEVEEINAKISNFEADTGLKIENKNYIKTQTILAGWQAENAKLETEYNRDTMEKRKELLDKTIDQIYQEIQESERRIMGMDIDQEQKQQMFSLEQRRIIAETTKAQAEAARNYTQKINAELEQEILKAQQKGENEKVEILKQQKKIAEKQTKIIEQEVKRSETAAKLADWEYSVRIWTKINETLSALSGVVQATSNLGKTIGQPAKKQDGYTISY